VKDTVCAGCSLACDDVAVAVKGGKLESLGLCRLGHEYCSAALGKARLSSPFIREAGKQKPVSLEEALDRATQILSESSKPLLYGWSGSTDQVVKLGLQLARTLKGVFDSTASLEYGQLLSQGLEGGEAGRVSLEEVRNRCDHVVYWGANPAESHHRHASRFSVFPRGEGVPEGRESRIVTVIDVRQTETMRIANHRLIIHPPEAELQLLQALIKELEGSSAPPGEVAGIPALEFLGLAKDLRNASYVAIFYGSGLTHTPQADKALSLLAQLVQTLNSGKRRCVALPLVSHCNTIGAVKACLAEAGHPYAADFSSNPPTPHPSTPRGLAEGEFDAALTVGVDALSLLPGPAARALRRLPLVALSPLPTLTTSHATVAIPAAFTGSEAGGTIHRLDGVQITLQPFHSPPKGIPTEDQFLTQLIQRL